jgi:DNA-binding MarR family transcriptional regulator
MQATAVSAQQLADELMSFLATTMKTAQGEVFKLVDELDLSMTQLKMLHLLDGAARDLTPSELAKFVDLSPAATGRAVDALARRDIVSRREDETDRRVKRLALTAHGRECVNRISAARLEGLLTLTETLDPAQREALSLALAPLMTPPSSPDCATCAKEQR